MFWITIIVLAIILYLVAVGVVICRILGRRKCFGFSPPSFLQLSLTGAALGTVALGGAVTETMQFRSTAVRSEGTVIELVRIPGDETDTYAPRIEFQDSKGATHEFRSSTSSYPPDYAIGEKVAVLYLPVDPESARLDSPGDLWGLSLAIGGLVTGCLVVAAILYSRRGSSTAKTVPSG